MSIYKKGDTYFTSFRLPGSRKQYSKKLNSRSLTDAKKEDRAREVERDRLWKEGRFGESADMPWKALVDKYMAISEGNGNCRATLARKRAHFEFIDKIMGIEMVSGWDMQALEDLKLKSLRAGSAPSVVNKHLLYAKCSLALARRLKLKTISSDDVHEVGQVKNKAPESPFFLAEEQSKILAVASPVLRVATLLAGLGGVRRGEALGLKWSEVSFSRREMSIRDREDRRTKTRFSRTIPLHDVLLDELRKWRDVNPEETMVLPWRKYDDAEENANEFSHAFKRLCRKAGLEGSYNSLRHGFATSLAQADVSLAKIQKLMGHKSIKTTEKYIHIQTLDLPQGIKKLRNPLSSAREISNQISNHIDDFRQSGPTSTNINVDGGAP